MVRPIHALLGAALALAAAPAGAFEIRFGGHSIDTDDVSKAVKVGKSLRKGFTDLTSEEEYYIGRAVTARLFTQYPPVNDPRINTYLTTLGTYLSLYSQRPETYGGYRFQLVKGDDINAFAAPGGMILITTGLYSKLDNEEQLAAVVAHEIAHVTLKHGLAAIKTANLTEAFTILGSEALDLDKQMSAQGKQLTALFGESIEDVIGQLVINGYSKDQEFEADGEALRILHRAGYDTGGLGAFLKTLHDQPESEAGFFKTHPDPVMRLRKVNRAIEEQRFAAGEGAAARDARFQRYRLR